MYALAGQGAASTREVRHDGQPWLDAADVTEKAVSNARGAALCAEAAWRQDRVAFSE